MTARNLLTDAPPYEVEQAITRLGRDLRTARLRRNLTIKEVAEKIGTGRRAGRHAIEAQRGDLIAISAISGDTTTVRLSVAKAGSWQHIDLPEPVGITAGTLSPVRT